MSNSLNLRFKTKEEAKLHWDNAYNSNKGSFLCYCYENDVFYVCYKIPKIAYIKYAISRYFAEVICGKDPIAYLIKELSSEHQVQDLCFKI